MNVAHFSLGQKLLRYFRDPAVATWRKMAGFMAALYVVSPLDAIPDFIPLAGWLDDIGVLGAAAMFMIREITRHSEKARHATAKSRGASLRRDVIDGEVVKKSRRG